MDRQKRRLANEKIEKNKARDKLNKAQGSLRNVADDAKATADTRVYRLAERLTEIERQVSDEGGGKITQLREESISPQNARDSADDEVKEALDAMPLLAKVIESLQSELSESDRMLHSVEDEEKIERGKREKAETDAAEAQASCRELRHNIVVLESKNRRGDEALATSRCNNCKLETQIKDQQAQLKSAKDHSSHVDVDTIACARVSKFSTPRGASTRSTTFAYTIVSRRKNSSRKPLLKSTMSILLP